MTLLRLKPPILIALLAFVLAIAVVQDGFHALHHRYSFYLSESLLFSTYWLFFLPVAYAADFYWPKNQRQQSALALMGQGLLFTVVATLVHSLAYALVVGGLSALFLSHTYDVGQTLVYSLGQDFYKYVFVYGSLAAFRLCQPPNANVPMALASSPVLDKICVSSGKTTVVIDVASILFIEAASPYVLLHTATHTYLHTDTLKGVGQQLDARLFVRVHKSMLVNVRHVAAYTSRLNGDYDLRLSNGHSVRLSRTYLRAFRQGLVGTSA